MDTTHDIHRPCPCCSRCTCRCGQTDTAQQLPPVPLEPVEWTPWMTARAANA